MGSPVVIASPRKSPSSGRRTNKPLVEKKRRARINGCLGQLKSLILNAMQTEGAQVSRLEKADILEMTVKYLRHVQRQQVTATVTSEPEVMAKFSAGYTECASEVIRYMDSVKCVTPEIRSRLESHLVERLRGSAPVASADAAAEGNIPCQVHPAAATTHAPVAPAYSAQISSSTGTSEEMSRHYQTAVDLANMAAAVTAKETAAAVEVSTSSQPVTVQPNYNTNVTNYPANGHYKPTADVTRSQSISPASLQCDHKSAITSISPEYDMGSESRRRHSSSEASLSSLSSSTSSYQISSAINKDLGYYSDTSKDSNFQRDTQATNIQTSTTTTDHYETARNNNNNAYLSALQRPLHIQIPEPPTPPTSPSPSFLHSHIAYHQPGGHMAIPGAPSVASSARHVVVDDAPPTILYGVDTYHVMPNPNQGNPEAREAPVPRTAPSALQDTTTQARNSGSVKFFNNNKYNDHNNNCKNQNSHPESGYQGCCAENVRDNFQGQRTLPHQQWLPTTPSPPTLVKEEYYNPQIIERNGRQQQQQQRLYHNSNNYLNLTHDEQVSYNICRNDFAVVSSNYDDQYKREVEFNYRYHQHHNSGAEFHPQYHHHRDHIPNDQHQGSSHPSQSAGAVRECPSEQVPHTAVPFNNGLDRMNGPSPHPRVLSRQNDTSLSPPTLKRRLLFADGSEGERVAALRCSDGQPDKRRFLPHDEARHPDDRQNPQAWRTSHETQARLCGEVRDSLPAAMSCTVRAHAVSVDEGLWRPW